MWRSLTENFRISISISIRSEIKEPTVEEITERLNDHPYINFRSNLSEETTRA